MYTRRVFKQGDIGIGVNKHQAYLNMFQQRGFIQTRNLQDGVYGPRTIQAVKEFQRYSSLPEDGVMGVAMRPLALMAAMCCICTAAMVAIGLR